MKTIVLTLDYELFGNGSGSVFYHMIEPTEKLLCIANRYGAKITFFFEVIEYWKLKEEWDKGNSMGYYENPIAAIENQIRNAYKQGHDIQLHLHPQWVDAYWKDGKWVVNMEKWRLGGYQGDGEYSMANLFKRGKQTLEDLLKPVNPDYECIAMRAGGFNIQPSREVVIAMKDSGLYVDSSIYSGGKETGLLSNYDYTGIGVEKGSWHVDEELEIEGQGAIIELPIVAFPMIRIKKFLTWERLKGFLRNMKTAQERLAANTSTAEKKSGVLEKVKFFFQTDWQTWDFCLFSPSQHREFLKSIKGLDRELFVLIGHPKSYNGGRGLEYLLKKTNQKYDYKTISEVWRIEK